MVTILTVTSGILLLPTILLYTYIFTQKIKICKSFNKRITTKFI